MGALKTGRIVFGLSAVVFGVAAIMWHDSDMWQRLRLGALPFGIVVAWCLGIALVGSGIGMLLPKAARVASIVLGAIFLLFSLACVPAMVATPADAVQYVDFFELFCVVCGATAVYAAATADAARSATLGRVARLGLGVCTVSFAWAQAVYLQYTASLVPTWIPPNQMFWTILTTVAFALAAVAMLIDRQARLAMRLMTLMVAIFGVVVWVPHIVAQPHDLSNWNEISTNFLITGAAWLVADLRSF